MEIKELPETDERPWGRYTVLEERSGFKVKVLEVEPGARLVCSDTRGGQNTGW